MKLKISQESKGFWLCECPELPDSTLVGRGRTPLEALGRWVGFNQYLINLEIEVDESL